MTEELVIRPHGPVEFRTIMVNGVQLVSVLITDQVGDQSVDVEFRLPDFMAFAEYAANVAAMLGGIQTAGTEPRTRKERRWWPRARQPG